MSQTEKEKVEDEAKDEDKAKERGHADDDADGDIQATLRVGSDGPRNEIEKERRGR